jgi:CheY-like chemotaxis protein
MDGYSALSKIKEVRKDIVIIAQTAYGLLGDKEKILNSGFNDYVIKPILSQNLIDKLITNLSQK